MELILGSHGALFLSPACTQTKTQWLDIRVESSFPTDEKPGFLLSRGFAFVGVLIG